MSFLEHSVSDSETFPIQKKIKLQHQMGSDDNKEDKSNNSSRHNIQITSNDNIIRTNTLDSDILTNASVNADSCQAQVDNPIITSNETTEPENNTKYIYNNNKCKCTSYRTCKQCKSLRKQVVKRQRLQNRTETNDIYEKIQEELGQKALERLRNSNQENDNRIVKAFREMEMLVNTSAQKHAIKYCLIHQNIDILQVIPIYKILLLPEGALNKLARVEDKKVLRSEYKYYARLIHPDKNTHPQATIAFQKLTKYWHQIPNQ